LAKISIVINSALYWSNILASYFFYLSRILISKSKVIFELFLMIYFSIIISTSLQAVHVHCLFDKWDKGNNRCELKVFFKNLKEFAKKFLWNHFTKKSLKTYSNRVEVYFQERFKQIFEIWMLKNNLTFFITFSRI